MAHTIAHGRAINLQKILDLSIECKIEEKKITENALAIKSNNSFIKFNKTEEIKKGKYLLGTSLLMGTIKGFLMTKLFKSLSLKIWSGLFVGLITNELTYYLLKKKYCNKKNKGQ